MRKTLMFLTMAMVLAGAAFADPQEAQVDPLKETVILQLHTGNRVSNDDIQKLFTALTKSYLKSNASYILAHEIYRDRKRQAVRSSLVLTELDYGSFAIVNIRYTFSNGYFEFKLSQQPFTNIVNNEVVYSTDYDGTVGKALYNSINNKLQEAVYISRGYAAAYKKRSSASFYLFLDD
jgi:hypothetical protein